MENVERLKAENRRGGMRIANMWGLIAMVCLLLPLAWVGAVPYASTVTAASSGPAAPAQTPVDQYLDARSASDLIGRLTGVLNTVLKNDERKVESINGRWHATDLVGRTRAQALDFLFPDVRRVVLDPVLQKTILDRWKIVAAESLTSVIPGRSPTPTPTPTPGNAGGLTDARKKSLGSLEMSFFKSSLATDTFVKEAGNYKGQAYEIYRNSKDPDIVVKAAAVNRAVKLIIDKGLKIPVGLRFYLTNNPVAQNRAFPRDENWNAVAYVVLGPAAVKGGRPDALSASGFLGENTPTITTIHEIGHILHERSLGDAFWATGSIIAGAPTTGASVTGYANSSRKEFVAEVFAGMILGKRWPTDVLNEYRRYSGPVVP